LHDSAYRITPATQERAMQTIHQTNHHAPTHVPMLPPGTPAFTALVTEERAL